MIKMKSEFKDIAEKVKKIKYQNYFLWLTNFKQGVKDK